MTLIADLHIHSKYARACSKNLDIAHLEKYARMKGVDILGTGDFTHPKWIAELKKNLVRSEKGVHYTQSGFPFILQTEISLVYSQDNKGRRVHNLVLAPSFEVVDQITEALLKRGRVDYDGRPIFNISCPDFVEMLRSISKDIEVIPAHIFTPWFAMFGSMSGFNSVEECFKDQTPHIHALETGLSSDPAMNWRISKLDKYNLVSFSDLHSYYPWRMGREATLFDTSLNYKEILQALRDGEKIHSTIEFWPDEGKYHYDGHRQCNICLSPSESLKLKDICPKCKKKLTIGVAHRVEELADRKAGFKPKNAKPFLNLIPLSECIAGVLDVNVTAKKVLAEYNSLISKFKNEFNILLHVPEQELLQSTSVKIARAILKNRAQKIKVHPGYDGVYGAPLFEEKEMEEKQKSLAEF